ncbi:MAG: alpha/beta hydrolase [Alphaproteobacteria bacterium]|nr:alpha/beta hydrolase [Alphaproteobacteria bacterium]
MPPFIAIPALACDDRLYAPLCAALDRVQLTTIIPDADSFAACVDQVLQQAPETFVVMGTSFGGRVAMELTLTAPERVAGLVVIGAGPGPVADPVAGRRRSERIRGGAFEQVVDEMAAIISHGPGPNGRTTQQAFRDMALSQGAALMARQSDVLAKRTDLWPRLADITCPALMLWGVHDQFSPSADGLRMASAVARGRYVELPDCGHFPSLEYPDETAAAIDHWLRDSGLAQ